MFTLLLIFLGVAQASRTVRAGVIGTSSADSETSMPSEVSNAIRGAKFEARKEVKKAEAIEEIVEKEREQAQEAKAEAEQAEAEHEAAAKEANAAQKAANEQLGVAVKAAKAAKSSKTGWADAVDARNHAQNELQDITDDYQAYAEEAGKKVKDIIEALTRKEKALHAAHEEVKKKALEAEHARIAYEVAKESASNEAEELQQAMHEVDKATIAADEKRQAAKDAANHAAEAQNALNEAEKKLDAAKSVVANKKQIKTDLWDLYDLIEEFYGAASDVTKFMRRNEDCELAAHECLVLDGPGGGYSKLRAALEKWNAMVLKFMTIKELYPLIYIDLKPAEDEIEKNAMEEIYLSCDPYKELQSGKTEEEFNNICGDGLWPAVGLKKNNFYEPPPPDTNNGGSWFW